MCGNGQKGKRAIKAVYNRPREKPGEAGKSVEQSIEIHFALCKCIKNTTPRQVEANKRDAAQSVRPPNKALAKWSNGAMREYIKNPCYPRDTPLHSWRALCLREMEISGSAADDLSSEAS